MLNKVILMGNLTKDPELRYTATNVPVCSFTIAVTRSFAKPGEERQADFINCVAWRQTGEFISKYFTKGRKIAVSGALQTRTWDDQEGKRHFATEVVVDEAHFTDSKKDSEGESRPANAFGRENSQNIEGFTPIDSDDDLPF